MIPTVALHPHAALMQASAPTVFSSPESPRPLLTALRPLPLHLLPLLLVLASLSPLPATSDPNESSNGRAHTSSSPSTHSTHSLLWSRCERFRAFELGISEDLLPWHDDEGISERLMDRTLATRTMRAAKPGLPLAVRGGRLYVIDGSAQSIGRLMPWQAENIVVYAWALSRLVSRWGPSLPDVEFVVETMDTPFQDLDTPPEGAEQGSLDAEGGVWAEQGHGRLPVMRHCKTASSPDITVPTFHFYTLNFDDKFLSIIDRFNSEHPWEQRRQQAFSGGTSFHREQRIPSTTRQWDGVHKGEMVHMVRSAFSEYLSGELRHPNITFSPGGVPLEKWAQYKMVMNIDGITCSSRLWQLLALGSVVLREQSGYYAFYDKLLRRFHHYVPFWSHRPREVVWAYNWVVANDEAARAIAARGQQFAREYLNREALECYWVLLLRQYARLLRFTPGQRQQGPAAAPAADGQQQQEGGGEEGGPQRDGGGEGVRHLELVPIAEWLAAQDGRVKDWTPTRVAERVQHLNLLPDQPQQP